MSTPKVAPAQDLKTKEALFDYDNITVRRSAQLVKALNANSEIEDGEERAQGRAELMASIMVGWTADEILDMPAHRFSSVYESFLSALRGEIPNGNVTNS